MKTTRHPSTPVPPPSTMNSMNNHIEKASPGSITLSVPAGFCWEAVIIIIIILMIILLMITETVNHHHLLQIIIIKQRIILILLLQDGGRGEEDAGI